jgi:uncharacterized membrane protein YozB (DUF420 family)
LAARPVGAARPARAGEHRFWLALATLLTVLIVWGFGGSFFLRGVLPHRSSFIDDPSARTLYAVHGMFFGLFMALLMAQVGLAASGRVALHRRLGWASVVLLPLMAASGVAVALHALRAGFQTAPPDAPATAFFTVPVFSLGFFLIVAGLALHWRNRPATHKRLMIIATMMIAGAGTARIPQVAALGIPNFDVTQVLLLPMLWWDWRTLGRIHPATLWGGLALLATNALMGPIGDTRAWQALVEALPR